jgi:toxin FitB
VTPLPAHAALEAYSVLTRLPGGLAVPAAAAAAALADRFSEQLPSLAPSKRARVLQTLAGAGVFAGAAYDGLVALEAAAHDRVLLTLDQRAMVTYQRLGVPFRLIAG